MKRKNTIFGVAVLVLAIACLFLFSVKALGLSIIKHHETQLNDLTIKYYGDFNNIKAVKVYDGAIRRGTFELSISDEIIDTINQFPPYLLDLDRDGFDDLLIPHSNDNTGEKRYAVYFWNNDIAMYKESEAFSDLANIIIGDDHSIKSTVSLHNVLYSAQTNVPEIYEEKTIIKEFILKEDGFHILREYTLIYYSENDIYCYVTVDYDTETDEIISSVEDWLTPEQASKIELS